ncbi:copper-translocating P-type ATPase [Candidatus Berkelbacteria bacterium]|nr:copper-translocating P-type ATPase [Candidatus Berkelbacteria bacterium]
MLATHAFCDAQGITHFVCEHHQPIEPAATHPGKHTSHERESHNKHSGHSVNMFRDRFWITLILTIPVILYAESLQTLLGFSLPTFPGSDWLAPILGTFIFFYGGIVFLRSAWGELKARQPGMMTLIAIAITAAYTYSIATTFILEGSEFYWELSTLILVMLLGHWIEMQSVSAAGSALDELAKLLPDTAERLENGEPKKVLLSELRVGDRLLIRPGAKVPTDGRILEGESNLNESMVTGESKPVKKGVGNEVIGGTLNGNGVLTIEVLKVGEATALAGIMRLVAEAQRSKSRTQLLADRAAFYLTFIAIFASIGASIGWLAAGAATAFVLERAVSVLVIACPHALGLAVPLVVSISSRIATQGGLLIRDRKQFEAARNVNVVLFDKTGTLTTGQFGVSDIWPAAKVPATELLELTAAVEATSEHPIAQAILKRAGSIGKKATNVEALAGRGIRGQVGQAEIIIGGPQLIKERGIQLEATLQQQMKTDQAAGKTVVVALKNNQPLGLLALADLIRPESKSVVSSLHKLGVRVAMVTGDANDVAQTVAKELGIKEVFAEVLPEHKDQKVRELQKDGSTILMVGDGVNDAPALARANVGVAIGAGTDVAIESAGIILIKSDPRDIVKIIELARATYRKMIENLIWATGYNVIAIPLAAGVLAGQGIILPLWLGALFMSASTVIVAINAQLLRRVRFSDNK